MTRLLILLIFWCCPVFAAKPVDFIFDLDDTVINSDVRASDAETLKHLLTSGVAIEPVRGKTYRVAHGAREMFKSLPKVGFFSAHGDETRSQRAVQLIVGERAGETEILTRSSVFKLANLSENDRFRLQPDYTVFYGPVKKDLNRSANAKTHDMILVDNDPTHVIRGQEKNFIWVRNQSFDGEFARVRGLIAIAFEMARRRNVSFPEALWDLQWRTGKNGSLEYREDICESPAVYQLGYLILKQVNPTFVRNTLGLEDLKRKHKSDLKKDDPLIYSSIRGESEEPVGRVQGILGSLLNMIYPFEPRPAQTNLSAPPLSSLGDRIQSGRIFSHENVTYEVVTHLGEEDGVQRYLIRQSDTGALSQLRIAPKGDKEATSEIGKLTEFFSILKVRSLPHSETIAAGERFLLTEWLGEFTAREWLAKMHSLGDPKAFSLLAFINASAARQIYFSNLRPEDLVWNGETWSIVAKSGTLRLDLNGQEIYERYRDRLGKRWNFSLPQTAVCGRGLGSITKNVSAVNSLDKSVVK